MKAFKLKKFGVLALVAFMLTAFLSFTNVSAEGESKLAFTTDIEDPDVGTLNVDMYRIADIVWDGVNGKYLLRNVRDGFKDIFSEDFVIDTTVTETVESEELVETKGFDTETYANRCAKVVFDAESEEEKKFTPQESDPKLTIGNDPVSVPDGLFLAIARSSGATAKEEYIKKVDNKYLSFVRTEIKEYDFSPYLVFLNSDTSIGITKPNLKYQVVALEDGELIIEKELLTFGGNPVTFVFGFEITDPTGKVRKDVASITYNSTDFEGKLSADNFTKRITISNIPVGSSVIVTEIYAGAGYEIQGSDTVTISEIKSPVKQKGTDSYIESVAHFVNDQEDKYKSGFGINNEFSYGTSGWKFVKSSGGSDQ